MYIHVSKLNADIQAITDWFTKHGLVLNSAMSVSVALGTKTQVELINQYKPPILVSNKSVPHEGYVHNLGHTMDEFSRFNIMFVIK